MKSRNGIIADAGALIDSLRPRVYDADTPAAWALLGETERFANRLTDAGRMLLTVREARIVLTLLRLRASSYNAFQFRRRPSQRWINRHRNWPIA